jgi:hypothetical protein
VGVLGSEAAPMEQEAKTLRIAIGLLETTFDRLRDNFYFLTSNEVR